MCIRDRFNIEPRLRLFLVAQVFRDRSMDTSHRDRKPVASAFPYETLCLRHIGKSLLGRKYLFIRNSRAAFVAHHRPKLRLAGNPRFMRQPGNLTCRADVALKVKTGRIDHDGLVSLSLIPI